MEQIYPFHFIKLTQKRTMPIHAPKIQPILKSEARIMQECVVWYRNTFCGKSSPTFDIRCKIWHIPNENQQRLMPLGLLPGVPDLELYHGSSPIPLFFEVKTESHTSQLSPAQKDFQQWCKLTNHNYFVIRSLDAFQEIINGL